MREEDQEEITTEAALSERKFLHDLSSPLATVMISVEFVLDTLKEVPGIPEVALMQLEKADVSLEKANVLIQERRNYLKTKS